MWFESCSYVYLQLQTMLRYSCNDVNFTAAMKTKHTLYIASGSGPYHQPPPTPSPGARLIHISTHFALSLAPLLSAEMPQQSPYSRRQHATGRHFLLWGWSAVRRVVALTAGGYAGGGTCFRTRLRVYVQPASQPGRIDHFVCPSYHVIGLI